MASYIQLSALLTGLAALIFSFLQCLTWLYKYSRKSGPVGLILFYKVVHRVTIKSVFIPVFYFGIKTLKHWFNSACSLHPVMIQELSSNEQLGRYICRHLLWEENVSWK